ncbi:hypothetical protein ABZT08_06295 [Streptomyces sp. NPDC005526]|uniref:hypothetical protein n=1 Tax=Streptomyces sp. NPDC005526 TaxID=3156885 RepID=UPI0033A8D709
MRSHEHLQGTGARWRTTAAAAAAVLTFAGAVGCGAADGGGHVRAARGQQGPVREPTASEEALLDRAEKVLIKTCMAKAGFRFWVAGVPDPEEREGQGYVIDDVAWARRHGLGGQFERDAAKARRGGPNATYVRTLSVKRRTDYNTALAGSPEQGTLSVRLPGGGTVGTPRHSCRTAAEDELYGDFPKWFRVSTISANLTPLYVPDLLADRRFVKAVRAWSACMRGRGLRYADPAGVRRELPALTAGLSDARAHAVEVPLAVAEATCARASSLADTARGLEREYRARRTARYDADVTACRRMQLAALARARQITGATA